MSGAHDKREAGSKREKKKGARAHSHALVALLVNQVLVWFFAIPGALSIFGG
jgi:hypothetical protein